MVEKIIKNQKGIKDYIIELYHSKELILTFLIKDLSVKYRNTALGLVWLIVKSIIASAILIFIFSKVSNSQFNSNSPFVIFVYSGVVCWFFFQTTLSECSNTLIANQGLFSKVYIPKLVFIISSMLSTFVDFSISLFILFLLMIFYKIKLSLMFFWLPISIIILLFTAFTFSFISSLVAVKYRDFKYLIPFILQTGLYISPAAINLTDLSPRMQIIFFINPVTGPMTIFRAALFNIELSNFIYFLIFSSIIINIFILILSFKYFMKIDKEIVDII